MIKKQFKYSIEINIIVKYIPITPNSMKNYISTILYFFKMNFKKINLFKIHLNIKIEKYLQSKITKKIKTNILFLILI